MNKAVNMLFEIGHTQSAMKNVRANISEKFDISSIIGIVKEGEL